MPPNQLTEQAIIGFSPTSKPAKHGDGAGLFLLVNPNGSRCWRFRYRFNGKRETLALGVWPAVSLAMAREKRDELHALLAAGVDASEYTKAERVERAELARHHAEQAGTTRFYLDDNGGLTIRLVQRRFALTSAETGALRAFLDATKAVACKVTPCP